MALTKSTLGSLQWSLRKFKSMFDGTINEELHQGGCEITPEKFFEAGRVLPEEGELDRFTFAHVVAGYETRVITRIIVTRINNPVQDTQ